MVRRARKSRLIAVTDSKCSPEDLIGTAVALTTTIRSIGGTIGYAILYNVYLSRSSTTVYKQMATRLSTAGLSQASVVPFIKQYVEAVAGGNLQDIPQANATILAAANQGFQAGTTQAAQLVYYISIVFGAAAVGFCLCLPDMRRYMTDKVLVRSNSRKTW